MNLSLIRDNFKNYGVAAGVHDLTKKAVNRIVPVRVLRAVKLRLDRVERSFLDVPDGFEGRFASPDELRAWSADPRHDLDEAFLADAAARGDRCYAITRDGELASYGWYSKRPCRIDDTLVFHFDPAWVYMYKGFTLPAYRGKRLHAVGMARALEAYVREGSRGILSYVESNNFASLKSCYRMGYEDVGTIVVSRLGRSTYSLASPACRVYGLAVVAD